MEAMSTNKSARELAKTTSDAHSPAPKETKDTVAKQELAAAALLAGLAEPLSMSQVRATLRSEMADTTNLMKHELVDVRDSINWVCKRVDAMQESVERALAPIAERMEQHDSALLEHEELLRAMDRRLELQSAAMEQFRMEVLE